MKKIYPLVALVAFFNVAHAQSINTAWNKDITAALNDFLACEASTPQGTACTKYVGESLNVVYKLSDFSTNKGGAYMTSQEISEFVRTNSKWKSIGAVYDQEVLNKAQEFANAKKAVVAVYRNAAGVGHVAIITPGELQGSGSWGLKVPNAISFFQKEPSKSFVNKGLSFAFAKTMIKDITLYVREY